MTNLAGRAAGLLAGSGDVFLAGEHVAPVRYRVRQDQGVLSAETFGGTIQVPGFMSRTGTVVVLGSGVRLGETDEPFTLRMADGRELDFFATLVHGSRNTYDLLGAGDIRTP